MALKQQSAWVTVHLFLRLLGLTGLMVGLFGAALWLTLDELTEGPILAVVGAGVVGFALLFELSGFKNALGSRRGAMGLNVVLQIALAIVLVVGVNVFSSQRPLRFDLTWNHDFTLQEDIRQQLAQLRGETDIIIYQQNVSFGQRETNKQDKYDLAAQKKIIEKVTDLKEMFEDLGPRFRVQVLDIADDDLDKKLQAIDRKSRALRAAIDNAPENSIFFYSRADNDGKERIQRLSFSDIYQLDRQASMAANKGEGNLVLISQGQKGFANKVFNIEAKKPRIGVAVIHEVLGLSDPDDPRLTMAGLKEVLGLREFDWTEIILKKWGGGPPEPAAFTVKEYQYERRERQLQDLEASIKARQPIIDLLTRDIKIWQESTLTELAKKYALVVDPLGRGSLRDRELIDKLRKEGRKIREEPLSEEIRKDVIENDQANLELHQRNLKRETKEKDSLTAKQRGTDPEDAQELKRITDIRAKMAKNLADCDMLILPRMTLFNLAKDEAIPNRLYKLDDGQLDAIKEFIKSGKPVLFCLGPTNEEARGFNPDGGNDGVEDMLKDLGFQLPKQVVLYNVETKSFTERRGGLIIFGSHTEVPAIQFDNPDKTSLRAKKFVTAEPNPISASLGLAARAAAQKAKDKAPSGDEAEVSIFDEEESPSTVRKKDLHLRHPRPVYYEPRLGDLAFNPAFLFTDKDGWNEDNPFPSEDRIPRYEPPKKDDPNVGTLLERRQGSFPIAAAAQVRLPESWFSGDKKPPAVRLAVIGHGGIFSGEKLNPMREKLFLDVTNWLLGRDDLLTHGQETWEFPRVEMSETENTLWQLGARLGLPLFCVYLGIVMVLFRRMR